MAQFKAKLDERPWTRFLNRFRSKANNSNRSLRIAYATIGFRDIIQHFDQERGSQGRRWQKLSPSTLASRAKGGGAGSAKILQDTGNLRQNFAPTNTRNTGRGEVLIFNNAPYSGAHDEGDPSRNLPKRDFMYFTDKALDRMGKFLLEDFSK